MDEGVGFHVRRPHCTHPLPLPSTQRVPALRAHQLLPPPQAASEHQHAGGHVVCGDAWPAVIRPRRLPRRLTLPDAPPRPARSPADVGHSCGHCVLCLPSRACHGTAHPLAAFPRRQAALARGWPLSSPPRLTHFYTGHYTGHRPQRGTSQSRIPAHSEFEPSQRKLCHLAPRRPNLSRPLRSTRLLSALVWGLTPAHNITPIVGRGTRPDRPGGGSVRSTRARQRWRNGGGLSRRLADCGRTRVRPGDTAHAGRRGGAHHVPPCVPAV
mmetsp:Transcript_57591/g.128499  ORF Transcript_57591/g.128499 Transcript_57591/m.128499 type:complete len:269 (-) Transcript_57591:380-1186(-)